ncbi:MAG: hypothetical protein A2176_09390 [Spirochaetes bacterium RBG_13_51_14]|nr:MAG: hypothetical protein A2176_09390 [Spirochaetes bacterium RBG_13_51_14]
MGVNGGRRRGLLAIAFFMGLAAALVQVLLIREILSLCRGNELVIGVIFSSWFLGIFMGARFNPTAADADLQRRVLFSTALLPVLMAVSVYGAHAVQIIFPRTVGTFYSISVELLLALFLTLPASFFVGFFFPPLVALVSGEMKERSGGTVFYVESMGSFAGGIAFSFVLVEIANPCAIACGLLCASFVIIGALVNKKLIPLALVPLSLIFFSGSIEDQIFTRVWNRTHAGKLVHYQRTKYQTVAVESYGDTVSVYGDGILMYTLPDRFEARGLFHLINALRRDRGTMILMGSGPGSLLHNLISAGIGHIRYFEPDPELWDAVYPFRARLYPGVEGERLSVYREDLRHFLSRSRERFDMIVSIPPAPENIMLNRFYTREFYSLCKRHLSEQGIFVTSLHGYSNYLSEDLRDFIASIYRSFAAEFPEHLKTSGETMYLIGSAAKGALPRDVDELINRYKAGLPLRAGRLEKEITQNYSPDELRMFFELTQIRYFDRSMASAVKKVDGNRDLKPGAYWKSIVLTAFREQSLLYALIRGFLFLPALILVVSVIVFGDVRRRYGPRYMAAGTVIYCTGLVSISAVLVMILLYQNSHGIVYYRISLINALFMLGLTVGSLTANRTRIRLPLILAGLALSLGLVLVQTVLNIDVLFWALIILFSFLCGAVFPALFAAAGSESYMASASVLDSMDHFGSIAGSLLTVMVFLPVFGIQGTLIVDILIVLLAGAVGFLKFESS